MKKAILATGIIIMFFLMYIPLIDATSLSMKNNKIDGFISSTKDNHQQMSLFDGWAINLDCYSILSSPNVFDFNNDGKKEIVISTYGPTMENKYEDGRIYVISYDGEIAPGWPFVTPKCAPASPAIGDIDSNGVAEIVATCWYHIYVLRFDGSVVWQREISDYTSSSPVLANIDNDDYLEIILTTRHKIYVLNHDGSDVDGWPIEINPYYPRGLSTPAVCDLDEDGHIEIIVNTEDHKTYAFNHDGTIVDGWPIVFPNDPEDWWNIFRPPAVADLDGDGNFEIVRDGGTKLYVLEADGSIADGWPQDIGSYMNNAFSLGDIDSDGLPEIIFGRINKYSSDGTFYAFNGDGSSVTGWPIIMYDRTPLAPCVIADINSDYSVEVIGRSYDEIYIFDYSGHILNGWPKSIDDHWSGGKSSPLVTDLDGDGYVEIVAPSSKNQVNVFFLSGRYTQGEWPMYQHDSYNTGCYVWKGGNRPPFKPTITGPTSGKVGDEMYLCCSTTDPDGDTITTYEWDLVGNDFCADETTNEPTINYIWNEEGIYSVRVRAIDEHGLEGVWSDSIEVTMPKSRSVLNNFPVKFFDLFPNAFQILRYFLSL